MARSSTPGLYDNAGRSVLAAITVHFVGNATGQLIDLSPDAQVYQSLLTALLTVAVVRWWGPERLRRDDR